jgi:nitrogen fixation protein NifU and related proteins
MTGLNELYQEVIIDHGRRPRNFMVSQHANCIQEGFNPLCGDRLTIYLTEEDGMVADVSFQGSGCAISMASASLMTEAIKGKPIAEARRLFSQFHQLLTKKGGCQLDCLGKLSVLAGVAEFPARVKCATLAWHTLIGAISHEQKTICTEKENEPT